MYLPVFFFFKQKTAYDMRISDWSADVCSSDLRAVDARLGHADAGIVARECADRAAAEILEHRRQIVHHEIRAAAVVDAVTAREFGHFGGGEPKVARDIDVPTMIVARVPASGLASDDAVGADRSEEQTYELQSLMRSSYAGLCL